MSRYFFYDNGDIPARYEETVPQVFPTTAPGNFTWLPEIGHYVLTTFYPYQWDLNYRNPRVFNEMMYNFLFLANQGMDIIRIDAVPYIWKELGTSCRNLKEVHTIVRMMRMIAEIVCPSVILLGEVVMEPEKVVPYFGTVEKPECHMLYNVTTMATTWNSIATRDIRLLKKQMDIVSRLPKQYTFLNYLRCHDDIGWGLDFDTMKQWGMEEPSHKRYLNDYFTGKIADSISRGELYNDDPVTQDARFCGTTASMCGIEAAGFEGNAEKMQTAIQEDLMLHAYMLTQSGIPMLYSGDELGQVNDYSYKEDAEKVSDSRYLQIRFQILGDGPTREMLENLAKERKIQNVKFTGYVPYEQMAAYLVKSDVLINSFVRKAPQSIVTKIGDYLAAGKPMINTCMSPEFRKKVEQDGFGINIEPEDVRELVNAVEWMYENEAERNDMGNRARKIAEEQFDRPVSYGKIEAMISSLITKRK